MSVAFSLGDNRRLLFKLLVITVLSGLLGEVLCLWLAKKPIQVGLHDSSSPIRRGAAVRYRRCAMR